MSMPKGHSLEQKLKEKPMARIVKSITLTPWALTCILGALHRDARQYLDASEKSKGDGELTAIQCASDAEHIASMLTGISSPSLESFTITVSESEG